MSNATSARAALLTAARENGWEVTADQTTAQDMTVRLYAAAHNDATVQVTWKVNPATGNYTVHRVRTFGGVAAMWPAGRLSVRTVIAGLQRYAVPARRNAVQGVVVAHAGATLGSLPHHTAHPATRAALRTLDGHCYLAELRGTSSTHKENNRANGVMVEPRGDNGRVAVYLLEAGQVTDRQGNPPRHELARIADLFRAAGWIVEPGTRNCVMAWEPTMLNAAAAALPPLPATGASTGQWVATDKDGRILATGVHGATMDQARAAALRDPRVSAASRAQGGFALRRLISGETE